LNLATFNNYSSIRLAHFRTPVVLV